MLYDDIECDYEVIWTIVNDDFGHKVLKTAYNNGVLGGTIMLAMGYLKNPLLRILGINEIRREVVMMVTNKNISKKLLPVLEKEFHLNKLKHGITFSIKVQKFLGSHRIKDIGSGDYRRDSDNMYNVVFTVVDKGKGEDIIELAFKLGTKGGTIINGRGSGINDTCRLFSIEVEPEKEIVMIITHKDSTEKLVEEIKNAMEIGKPCSGVIFVQEIHQIYGVF